MADDNVESADVLPAIAAEDIVSLLTLETQKLSDAEDFCIFAANQTKGTPYEEFFTKLSNQLQLSHELLVKKIDDVKKIG